MDTAAHGVSLADVFVTEELRQRTEDKADYLQEKRAIQELAARMLDDPAAVLPEFVDMAMHMVDGVSAGLSLLEEGSAPKVFRWRYLRGQLTAFENATTPRDDSPCGVTLDQMRPTLSRHPERYYEWIAEANIVVPEVLLVPLYRAKDEPLGTLWIVSDEIGHFNAGHARALSELAAFVSIALRLLHSDSRMKQALDRQQVLAEEMSHRVNNLFALVDAIVRLSVNGASTKDELARMLVGRIRALADAHGLVRHDFSDNAAPGESLDLAQLLRTIALPYELSTDKDGSRFTLQGPSIQCGRQAVNGIALIFHELATNAAKHGALGQDSGRVDVTWSLADDKLKIRWVERGGPAIERVPETAGFGSKLLQDTVTRQFRGTLGYGWKPDGVEVTASLALDEVRS